MSRRRNYGRKPKRGKDGGNWRWEAWHQISAFSLSKYWPLTGSPILGTTIFEGLMPMTPIGAVPGLDAQNSKPIRLPSPESRALSLSLESPLLWSWHLNIVTYPKPS